jgi:hypothetical protein
MAIVMGKKGNCYNIPDDVLAKYEAKDVEKTKVKLDEIKNPEVEGFSGGYTYTVYADEGYGYVCWATAWNE